MATIDIKLKTYEQLQFEIIRMNTDIYLKDKEIERLNNIINELEKDTIDLMKSYKNINAPRYDMCKYFIYKINELKELKEGDNND